MKLKDKSKFLIQYIKNCIPKIVNFIIDYWEQIKKLIEITNCGLHLTIIYNLCLFIFFVLEQFTWSQQYITWSFIYYIFIIILDKFGDNFSLEVKNQL